MRPLVLAVALLAACAPDRNTPPADSSRADSSRAAFGRAVDSMLLDTERHEMRAVLTVKVPDPKDEESPIRDSVVPHPPAPGPHTLSGRVFAEIGVLRALLGTDVPVEIDTVRHRIYVGRNPEVLLMGHPHGDAWYVDVKLFARQFGAYVDIDCTMGTCAHVWPRAILERMRTMGMIGSGVTEAHAEGIVTGVDVRRLPPG